MLEIEGLTMSFRGIHALENVDVTIPEGRIVGLIGPNGAGKSTLVNCVTGAIPPNEGSIRWCGEHLERLSSDRVARLGLARTFQHARLFHGYSVLDNVMIGAHLLGSAGMVRSMLRTPRVRRDESLIRTAAEEALEVVGVGHLRNTDVEDLTAGQQRLVALARALASKPSFLLLDEPAAGLTDIERAALLSDLQSYFAEHGVTGLVIEHHLGFLMELVDEVIVLVQGAVLTQGDPRTVQSDSRVIEAYVGV